jgi:type IV fimbrial biogenesis protein FimT
MDQATNNPQTVPACGRLARRGMTLLELVIGLAVVAVLAAMAWPSLSARMARERLNAAAEALATDLNEARFEAARRGQPVFVATSAGTPWCWRVAVSASCEGPCSATAGAAPACQLHTVQAKDHPGLQLLAASDTHFLPDGAAVGVLRAIFENRSSEQLQVTVSPSGRPRICTARGAPTRHPAC